MRNPKFLIASACCALAACSGDADLSADTATVDDETVAEAEAIGDITASQDALDVVGGEAAATPEPATESDGEAAKEPNAAPAE